MVDDAEGLPQDPADPEAPRLTEVQFLAHRLDRVGRQTGRIGTVVAAALLLWGVAVLIAGLATGQFWGAVFWSVAMFIAALVVRTVSALLATHARLRAAQALER